MLSVQALKIYFLCQQFYKDILKPAYNAVDMIEVELMDDTNDPRDFNSNLIQVTKLLRKKNLTLILKNLYSCVKTSSTSQLDSVTFIKNTTTTGW